MSRRLVVNGDCGLLLVRACLLFVLLSSSLAVLPAEHLAELDYDVLPEASGMAVSARSPDRVWFINDSGNRSELIAFDYLEDRYQRYKLRKTKNKDWEDLAAFEYRGEPWLAVADVGDNNAKRKHVRIYLLPEPGPEAEKVSVYSTLELTYPQGPRDVESVAVDSVSGTLYLLSKREKSPRLYSVVLPDLEEGGEYQLTPTRLGKVTSIPAPTDAELKGKKYAKYHAQPTAMEMLPDGSAIALLTYGGVYLARLDERRDWYAALEDNLCAVAAPRLKQAETIAADAEGRIYTSSEGRGAPLLRFPAACAEQP